MSTEIEDEVIAIMMHGEMRVRLSDWTPAWLYDALYERILDSKSIDLDEVSDGDVLGRACVDDEKEVIKWFNPASDE